MVSKLNLTKLLSPAKDSLVFGAQLAVNGRTVEVSCLGDTGADGYIFVNENLVGLLASLGLRTRRLPEPCPVTGFDGGLRDPITHAVKLPLMIDGRVQIRQPMLVTELGKHDVILGKMWFAEHGVLPDCKNHRLIWPEQTSLREEVITQASRPIPKRILRRPQPCEDHQRDADRRDKAIDI